MLVDGLYSVYSDLVCFIGTREEVLNVKFIDHSSYLENKKDTRKFRLADFTYFIYFLHARVKQMLVMYLDLHP